MFLTCTPIRMSSVSWVHTCLWTQFWKPPVMLLWNTFYFVCVCNEALYTAFGVVVLLFTCLFISLGLRFPPCFLITLILNFMASHDVLYLPSRIAYGIQGNPVCIYIGNALLLTTVWRIFEMKHAIKFTKCYVQ